METRVEFAIAMDTPTALESTYPTTVPVRVKSATAIVTLRVPVSTTTSVPVTVERRTSAAALTNVTAAARDYVGPSALGSSAS